ncbi:MAG: hypothetical protein AAGG72_09465 [Pseudomonadota bacterium]
MRLSTLFALLATALFAFGHGVPTASAGGLFGDRAPLGFGTERVVRHHVYAPRYRHSYRFHRGTDPYAYRYEPRGYYPYYNSGYWRPAHKVRRKRHHFVHPPYYKAWGDHRRGYHHREWHRKNHGRIKRSHF